MAELPSDDFPRCADGLTAKRARMSPSARHTTVELTLSGYTHPTLYDSASAVELMPRLPGIDVSNEDDRQSMRATGTDDVVRPAKEDESLRPSVYTIAENESSVLPFCRPAQGTQRRTLDASGCTQADTDGKQDEPASDKKEAPKHA